MATPATIGTAKAAPATTPVMPIDTSGEAYRQGLISKAQYDALQQFRDFAQTIPVKPPAVTPCAPARQNQSVKLWLIDTGCGHDLVCRKELEAVKHILKTANIPLDFHTA